MKNAILTLILIGLFRLDVSGQSLPTQKDQYNFLQWYIKKNNLIALSDSLQQLENASFKITGIEALSRTDRQFTKKDIAYIKRQILDKKKPLTLDTTLLRGHNWKPAGAPHLPVTYISMPVFTRNKHIVLINRTYICGNQCGDGGVEIYIRDKDGKWMW